MSKLWNTVKQDMQKDYSYLCNKDIVCSFKFELKHDVNWWIKYRKWQWIWLWGIFSFLILFGTLFGLLQIYGNQVNIFFIPGLVALWIFAFSSICGVYAWQYQTIHNATNYLLSLLKTGTDEGYICSDQSKYPYFMQIAFNGSTQNTWKLCASWADKEPKCNMPIWGLVALFCSIKQYQTKYCPVIQTKQDNRQAN